MAFGASEAAMTSAPPRPTVPPPRHVVDAASETAGVPISERQRAAAPRAPADPTLATYEPPMTAPAGAVLANQHVAVL